VIEQIGSTMFLSSNHHLLAVRTGRVLAAAAHTTTPGTVVSTTVDVEQNGELDEQDEDDVGQVNGNLQVQATVTAVGTARSRSR
jgi:hypothetical protein